MRGFFVFLSFTISSFAAPPFLSTVEEIESWLSLDEEKLRREKESALQTFFQKMTVVLESKEEERSFHSIVHAWDEALGEMQRVLSLCEAFSLVHPKTSLQETCQAIQRELQGEYVSFLSAHPALYTCLERVSDRSDLSLEQRYYLEEQMAGLRQMGLHLPLEKQAEVAALHKEIFSLSLLFQKNIQEDRRCLFLSKGELAGLPDSFLSRLSQDEEGRYAVTLDTPVYLAVMKQATEAKTRQRLFQLSSERAYPSNEPVLDALIKARGRLAHILGFADFASLDLAGEMAKDPEKVESFLSSLLSKVSKKVEEEFAILTEDLPSSVEKTEEGKVLASDSLLLSHEQKKKKFDLDETKISEYFPIETVLDGLAAVFSDFFHLSIKRERPFSLWDKELYLLSVRSEKGEKLLGHILLDLFPRPGKYSHACEVTLSPAYCDYPALALVVTNFPEKTKERPALLLPSDVRTLFHEFGHAMHDLLGRSNLFLCCGTKVKTDFVELPSQLLEEWTFEPSVLKKISAHYDTKEPLSSQAIESLVRSKTLNMGHFVQRQAFLSLISLYTFKVDAYEQAKERADALRKSLMSQYAYEGTEHSLLSFGHLSGYGAKYYGYLWSKVFAVDLFNTFKQEGLFGSRAGERYRKCVLEKGGSEDPNLLLRTLLGREPSLEGFLPGL